MPPNTVAFLLGINSVTKITAPVNEDGNPDFDHCRNECCRNEIVAGGFALENLKTPITSIKTAICNCCNEAVSRQSVAHPRSHFNPLVYLFPIDFGLYRE